VPTTTRRLVPLFLAALLLVPTAGVVAAADEPQPPTEEPQFDEAWQTQAGLDLVKLANGKRATLGLVALRIDETLMSIARDRAEVMAANDVMSHTEPGGGKVFDRITAAGLTWYGAGEIIAWNNYPIEYTTAESIRAWMASPGHRSIMVSTGYNYVGFGAAISESGKKYYAGVYARLPDHTGALARFRSVSRRTIDARHKRVTIRWSGADARLQVGTAGLRYFEVQRRSPGGEWRSWGVTYRTSKTITWTPGKTYEVRVRARDKAGNWGAWRTIIVRL
jgi:uncharacterized protein YkwD